MPKINVKSESFKGSDGKDVSYERVTIESAKNPSLTVELRVPKNELSLIKAIVAADK